MEDDFVICATLKEALAVLVLIGTVFIVTSASSALLGLIDPTVATCPIRYSLSTSSTPVIVCPIL